MSCNTINDKLTVLMILDGYGLSDVKKGNAIAKANTPNLDKLMAQYPCEEGLASGMDVGLPDGQMGNSEVGHLNIGAGRIVYQELTRITKSIADGDFFENKEMLRAVENCKANDSALHMMGLLSDGGVHSHIQHLYALLKLAKDNGLKKVYVHAFLDGRDTPPTSGKEYLHQLQNKMNELGIGQIVTVSGRYYAMDRDKNWDRVKVAYDALVMNVGERAATAAACIEHSYAGGVNDEFVKPTLIGTEAESLKTRINENDSIIFFNFRPDRAREISRAFCVPDFAEFERGKGFMKLCYVCFKEYDITIPNKFVAFEPDSLENTLGEYLSSQGVKQLRLAETEKYAHVTFFFNGGVEKENPGEERILIPSPKVATYDLKPEMSANEVTDTLVEKIRAKQHNLIIINYANCDMVGHTGVFDAAVKAVEAIDVCIGRVMEALIDVDGQMFICADHGNSDKMYDFETNEPFTAHTTNPVPFILVNCKKATGLMKDGKLCDIAPTLLDMMNIPKPPQMTGHSLLIK